LLQEIAGLHKALFFLNGFKDRVNGALLVKKESVRNNV
jgi:hypothetical protein